MERTRDRGAPFARSVLLVLALLIPVTVAGAASDDTEAREVAKAFWVSRFTDCERSYLVARTRHYLIMARNLDWEVRSDTLTTSEIEAGVEWNGSTSIRCTLCAFFQTATGVWSVDTTSPPLPLRLGLRKQHGVWLLTDASGSQPDFQPASCADLPRERPRLLLAHCNPGQTGSAVAVQSVDSCTKIYFERALPPEAGHPASASPSDTPQPVITATPRRLTSRGPYLQVAALPDSNAQWLVGRLKSRGLSVSVQPSPARGLVRVLVGPFEDERRLYWTKFQMEADGFAPIVRGDLHPSALEKTAIR